MFVMRSLALEEPFLKICIIPPWLMSLELTWGSAIMPKLNEFYKFTQPIFSFSLSHHLPLIFIFACRFSGQAQTVSVMCCVYMKGIFSEWWLWWQQEVSKNTSHSRCVVPSISSQSSVNMGLNCYQQLLLLPKLILLREKEHWFVSI